MSILRLVLAFFISPAAVFLTVGFGVHFWLNIVLYLLGWLPGVIHAVYIIGTRDGRRK